LSGPRPVACTTASTTQAGDDEGIPMAPTRYELRVQGRLSPDVSQDFEEFDVSEAPAETILLGEVVDSAHLHGVLARLESFGLQIVSLRAMPK
jgi:hypothetical protein